MSSTNLARINPTILQWAIARSRIPRDEILRKMNIQARQLEDWELGEYSPPFDKALKLAEVLKLPFGYFYLNSPPEEELPIEDLRTMKYTQSRKPSPDFLELINTVLVRQDWYREYALENNKQELSFVSKYTVNDEVIKVADEIRQVLQIGGGLRQRSRTRTEYLGNLVKNAENVGIIVMRSGVVAHNPKRSLSINEFRGFAVSDKLAPIVFINTVDSESARIFTLLHEIAHIWIGKSAVSNPEEIMPNISLPVVETFCNSVATEVLVPAIEFISVWNGETSYENIQGLARHFLVSAFVVIRRADELGLITKNTFFNLLANAQNNIKTKKDRGGNFKSNLLARTSPTFFRAVISDVKKGRTLYREAARLLNVKVKTIKPYVEDAS